MGFVEELVKNKQDLLLKFLEVLQGKETNVKVNLDGVKMRFGSMEIEMGGDVEFTFVPLGEKKPKSKG
jgi:hypothetical protein